MSKKPTYKELEKRVKQLEKAESERKQVEEVLHKSEEKYRGIFDESIAAVYVFDEKKNFIDSNQAGLDLLGYSKDELLRLSIPDVDADPVVVLPAHKQLLSWENIVNYEHQLRRKDGMIITVLNNSRPLTDTEGDIIGMQSTLIDITERRQAEEELKNHRNHLEELVAERTSDLRKINEELKREITERKQVEEAQRESEEKFRTIFQAERDAIMVFDDETLRFIEANDATLELYGYTKEEFLKLTPVDISAKPEETSEALKKIVAHLPIDEYDLLEREHKRKDGTIFLAEISTSSFVLGGRNMICGIVRDVTKRVRVEEALRDSEEKYRLLVENANDAIFIIQDGIVKFPNFKTEEMTGYSVKELYEIPFVNIIHPDDREMVLERRRKRLLGEKPPSTYSFRMINKSGDELLVHINTVLITWEGNPATINFIRDITEQKRLEAQLHQAQKMESVGLLAGGVAHDLNNVLSGIVSYPELLLLDLPEDSKLREPIKTMKESGFRASAIVQDLLTVARGVAATKEPLNLNDLVKDYINSPEFKRLKEFHPVVTIKLNLYSNLLNITGSHVHIRKVIMNLVSNASEAIDGSGNVIISTMNRYIDRPLKGYDDVTIGEYAVLTVSDDGSGISSGDLERIFDPFYTKKVLGRSGTGLGLAVVWNVVQDHEGYIDVKSDEYGTMFELYFSITRDEISDKVSIPIKDYKGSGETILVVDDVESQRKISCKMLETLGYKTKAVSSGEEAVEYLKENAVDLILLDMIMEPGINGRETYERIIKIHPNQKAIITSGFAETDDVKKAQQLGAGQYIKKPLTLKKIGIAVRDELKM